MMRWVLMLCCSLLAACAGTPALAPPDARTLLHDKAFKPPAERPDAAALFTLSEPMQTLVTHQLAPNRGGADPRRGLVDQLYRRQKLALEYDSTRTRTAAEAYEARAGNCLSLVIMTAAFAKALNMPVRFQRVDLPESWTRSGGLQFASGHVNIALDLPTMTARWLRGVDPSLVVDFVPADELRGHRLQGLAESTVVAMFMNNRAAETLAAGDADTAYWWAREAVLQDPRFAAGWNTLGVVYLHRGLVAEAEALFNALLEREPDNPKVLGNLASALDRLGRADAARGVREHLARIDPQPPFFFFDAGLLAMRDRDYERARDLFARELRRDAYWHELHFWMAQAELALGHLPQGRRHLEMAREASTTPQERQIYAAKLDRLKALR